jgi:hypothetical protein
MPLRRADRLFDILRFCARRRVRLPPLRSPTNWMSRCGPAIAILPRCRRGASR